MKKRMLLLAAAVLLAVVSLFMPAMKVYVHSQIGADTAALFPPALSAWDLAAKGAGALPVDAVPALGVLCFSGWLQAAAAALLCAAGVLAMTGRRKLCALSIPLAALALALSGTFAVQQANLASSLLFQLLFTVQMWVYMPAVSAVLIILTAALALRGTKAEREQAGRQYGQPSLFSEGGWRRLMGVLAVLAALMLLLPVYSVRVPDTLTAEPADAAALNRSVSLLQAALGRDGMLNDLKADGHFSAVLTGDLGALEPYSADGNNINGIFLIPASSSAVSANPAVLAAGALLLLAALLAFLPRVDKWFPTVCALLGAIALGSTVLGVLGMSAADMYTGQARQILHLGLGTVTPFALIALGTACFAALGGALCIRTANAPYFVNPIPQKQQLRAVALVLAALSLACILLPAVHFSFYTPGKTKVSSTPVLTGLQSLTLRAPESVAAPVNGKGVSLYKAEAAEGMMDSEAMAAVMHAYTRRAGLAAWAALLLTSAGLAVLLLRKSRKAAIALFLTAFAVRLLGWLLMGGLPKSVGTAGGTAFYFASLPLLVFSAFFANFADMEDLPKKYKLFLMMLPFLLAVFLFSYLPLYGWSYAFFNYKFGLPLSEQEFVGFKWFTEMFTNPANRDNILRVLKNTFGMSGLNLLTSWMPMIFAVFLNEITNTRFKKFVQIFTTLPNFISWALVFSFAMCLFSMDTGIWSKLMLRLGVIQELNVPWLNSGEHIWLKMWGWSTWKGLGWGAIMYLAAIAGIPQELYEAARVDGANRWHQMRYITLPSLLPTFFVLLMLSISNILNNGMEQYLVFQNPMNRQTIEVLDLYVYNITIASRGTTLYSFATAIGILKTIVSVTLLFSANFASKKLRGESIV